MLLEKFENYIEVDLIEEAKTIITRDNVVVEFGLRNVIWIICCCLPRDDPELLEYFTEIGAPIFLSENYGYSTTLSIAALRKRPKMVRKLLDLGHPPNQFNERKTTALDQIQGFGLIAKILIDAGGRCAATAIPEYMKTYCSFRDSVRSSAISTMGAMRAKYGKDVSRIIGRCVWSLRGIYEK